jgi:biotin operon repressor
MEEFVEYYCSAEWHLAKLKSRYASLIYSLALRLSKSSGKFFGSGVNLGNYFGCHRNTVYKAIDELQDSGLFVLISQGYFEAKTYHVLTHEEWATKYPNECANKLEFAWSSEDSDQLGKQLYATSGGKVTVLAHQLKALRKTGLTDQQIVSCFDGFLANQSSGQSAVMPRFIKYLRGEGPKGVAA